MAAHITAAAVGGPRYNSRITTEQRRHFNNGIWMCGHHGTLVDRDHQRYSVTQLRGWKRKAEALAQKEHEGIAGRKSTHRSTTHVNVNITRPSEGGQPRIVFVRPAGSALYRGPNGPYLYYAGQLWFRNEPETGGAVARSLTASVTFSHMHSGEPLFPEVRAEWAIANAADNVGFDDTREMLDELPPVGEFAKLIILQKRIEESSAYAWSRGAREYTGRRHVSHQIPPGDYQLSVRIRGLQIDETFHVSFTNPGQGADPTFHGLQTPDVD